MKHASCLPPILAAVLLASCQATSIPGADTSSPPPAAADTCSSHQFAWLVGQDHKQAPPTAPGKVVRVVCDTCPMTMDYNAGRLNVIYDAKTGVVRKLTCG